MSKSKTIEEFKEELKSIWGNKYIVSPDAIYVNTHVKIKIICPKHGYFFTEPNSILHGHGCKECRRETIGKNRVLMQNVAVECQGKQHYTQKSKYGENGEFLKIQERDMRKFDLCNEHGLRILYYTNYKGEIPELYKPYTYFYKEKLLEEIKR